jgi:2,3-bisphosphoglycerate-dependent phosphoglycerate mutase
VDVTTGTLILIRHGQSLWNLENRFTGWTDVPLTEQGEAEARYAGEKLKGYRFDRAFTSDLSRAQESLRIILEVIEQTDIPVEYSQALNERHYGDLQGLNKAETADKLGQEVVFAWRRTYEARPPGGESLKDTHDRVMPYYVEHIEPYVVVGETVLVVAHSNSMRALMMDLDQISPEEVPDLYILTGVPRRYLIDSSGEILERDYL